MRAGSCQVLSADIKFPLHTLLVCNQREPVPKNKKKNKPQTKAQHHNHTRTRSTIPPQSETQPGVPLLSCVDAPRPQIAEKYGVFAQSYQPREWRRQERQLLDGDDRKRRCNNSSPAAAATTKKAQSSALLPLRHDFFGERLRQPGFKRGIPVSTEHTRQRTHTTPLENQLVQLLPKQLQQLQQQHTNDRCDCWRSFSCPGVSGFATHFGHAATERYRTVHELRGPAPERVFVPRHPRSRRPAVSEQDVE